MILRTARAFKLVNKWKPLGELLTFIWNSISDIANFAVLLSIVIFMFALIGMELFANCVKFNEENKKDLVHGVSDRMNYDDIGNALRSVFDLLVGDNWTTTLFLYTRFNMASAVIFFLSAFFVINLIMLNLFLAIILQNFFQDEQKKILDEEDRSNQAFLESKKSTRRGLIVKKGPVPVRSGEGSTSSKDSCPPADQYKHREWTLLIALKIFRSMIALGKEVKAKHLKVHAKTLVGMALMIFSAENKLRRTLYDALLSSGYQAALYVVMFVYSVMLSFHTSMHDPDGGLRIAVKVVDITTAVFFSLDAFCKIVIFGLISNGEKSYLRSGWNILDLLLTIIQIVNLAIPEEYIAVRKMLFMCSVLRILRIVTASEGFRLCIQAIINGAFKIAQTLFIAILFFFIFGVIGIQLFGGYLFYCDRTNLGSEVKIVTAFDCMNMGGDWRDRDVNFNNIFSAILTLFELFTGKSLTNLYKFLPDVTDIDLEPVRDSQPYYALFIIAFMIIGFIFIKAILTGVISDTFFKEKDILQGFKNLTPAQLKWAKLATIMFKAHPTKMYSKDSRFYPLYRFLSHPAFNWFIIGVLVLNGVALSLTWHRVGYRTGRFHGIAPLNMWDRRLHHRFPGYIRNRDRAKAAMLREGLLLRGMEQVRVPGGGGRGHLSHRGHLLPAKLAALRGDNVDLPCEQIAEPVQAGRDPAEDVPDLHLGPDSDREPGDAVLHLHLPLRHCRRAPIRRNQAAELPRGPC